MRKIIVGLFMLSAFCLAGFSQETGEDVFKKKYIRETMIKVTDWQLKNPKHDPRDWTNGAFYAGVFASWETTGSEDTYKALMDMGNEYHWTPCRRWYHADDIAICQTYIDLYRNEKRREMIQPTIDTLALLMAHPYPAKGIEVVKWWWCDALFMAPPTLVKMGMTAGNKEYLDKSDEYFRECYDLLYNKEEHLFARDLNYVIKNDANDRRESNGKRIFWSRGNGWVMGGLARVLKELPEDYPKRSFYETVFKEMAAKIASLQQPDGLWRASLLDPDAYPGGEVSGSGFFCYALAWGINNKMLDEAAYLPVVEKCWTALNRCVNEEGRVGWVQPVGADPRRNFSEDSWEVYGTGAFLLAGSEVIKLERISAAIPSARELYRPFGSHDAEAFKTPPKIFYPETWFHYIGGNVSPAGITADLEAIAESGISGIQLFHGQFGGPWPGVEPQITCLSPPWDDAVKHTAEECRRLGLRFTMQNCPGWAMSGGPWIEPSNAMRHLVWSRTDVEGAAHLSGKDLPVPQPSGEDWRDYRDIAVLAFPAPADDTGEPLKPSSVKSNRELPWEECLAGKLKEPLHFKPATSDDPHWIEVSFEKPVILRTVELPSVNSMNHGWCYEPGVTVTVQAVMSGGTTQELLHSEMPQANWQDDYPVTLACSEIRGAATYRISIVNRHDMALRSLRLFSAARQNNWESEAGWTLRSIERTGEHPAQSPSAYIDPERIVDLSGKMDENGRLNWNVPRGKWTVLRIGHVNTGMRNSPAPPEGTGWECDKLSTAGAEAHFAGYIGRLSDAAGPLAGGLLNGMLMDSWECKTQTWTNGMEDEFQRLTGYPLREKLPAVFGYVIRDPETTKRFLHDWRAVIGDLFVNRFYGRMSELAKERGLSIVYETAAGDVFPADILEYHKFADVPMCEFWQPVAENFVGSINFKPIKPTASAARIYGKPRVAAEAFTSFELTWDEHPEMLKEVANINIVEGVTHPVFHTYTHNPRTDFRPPGTSFGSGIGTPFLSGQTWWKYMSEFNACLSRCTYMLERGRPVSDVLWYLGDEMNHKPDQNAPFPEGYKYDYCNPDVLLHRLSVKDGMLVTPEGITYRLLWIPPDVRRMLPQTLEKIHALVSEGATVVGDAPAGIATLAGGRNARKRFDAAVKRVWGKASGRGKGRVISGMSIDAALMELRIEADVTGGDALWLHRRIEGADWYFICAPKGKGFSGTLEFRAGGAVEQWDPVTGAVTAKAGRRNGNRTSVTLDLPKAGSCFIVFRHDIENTFTASDEATRIVSDIPLTSPWTLSFPPGWGAPPSLEITTPEAWKNLDMPQEAKAFSGTVTYTTTFEVEEFRQPAEYTLDLGHVEMIAEISLNGKKLRTLWTPPYRLDLTEAIQAGENTLTVEVTGTWFNRLVYDAGLPEAERKTWTINGPPKDAKLRDSGLLGPVKLYSVHFP